MLLFAFCTACIVMNPNQKKFNVSIIIPMAMCTIMWSRIIIMYVFSMLADHEIVYTASYYGNMF